MRSFEKFKLKGKSLRMDPERRIVLISGNCSKGGRCSAVGKAGKLPALV
jgi:hypothetical protein